MTTTPPTTVAELIKQKTPNFLTFLETKFPTNQKITEIKSQFETIPLVMIVEWIKKNLTADFHIVLIKLCMQFDIDKSVFSQEDLEKLKKYNEFFNEITKDL